MRKVSVSNKKNMPLLIFFHILGIGEKKFFTFGFTLSFVKTLSLQPECGIVLIDIFDTEHQFEAKIFVEASFREFQGQKSKKTHIQIEPFLVFIMKKYKCQLVRSLTYFSSKLSNIALLFGELYLFEVIASAKIHRIKDILILDLKFLEI